MSLPSNTDFEVESPDISADTTAKKAPWWRQLQYLAAGIIFGIILIRSEVISWFRIQEMFRLQSFHMYGVIGSAVLIGIIPVAIIKKTGAKTFYGEPITFHPRSFNKGQIFGGLLFGFGWALTGACPGPLFAQIGAGFTVTLATLASSILGTWVYGLLRDKLPH
ncbi:YeeE/YedE family protein [Chitinophaga ginsengisoli]|uniref:Uncharacterized protein n=1 Tax=Chitinophaga ginsengisoli TaxID=363837 RepID=A0A2P8G4J6_9BACT|nr:DUF6691 family protein [Chitinophaga ginsengisoli]PSL28887.1 hypothetical protein CLV42_10733 [Chitinophaga ginsengisoli]